MMALNSPLFYLLMPWAAWQARRREPIPFDPLRNRSRRGPIPRMPRRVIILASPFYKTLTKQKTERAAP